MTRFERFDLQFAGADIALDRGLATQVEQFGHGDASGDLAQDIGLLIDQLGVAIRTGHHCAQPLLADFGMESCVRASFHCYNTAAEVARLAEVVEGARQIGRAHV